MESPHSSIILTEMLSNPWVFIGLNDLIIELISPFWKDIVFKRLLVFLSNERSLLLFSEGVHWKAKNPLNKFATYTIFNIVLLDQRIGRIEGFLMLFRIVQ